VRVDGVDVTDRCIEASEEGGWAWCYVLTVTGRRFRDPATQQMAREKLTGVITYLAEARA
jgi:hypothetical protein